MKLINRSKRKGKLVIEKASHNENYTDLTQVMEHKTINENVCYEMIHAPDNDGVYESICGRVEHLNRPLPLPVKAVVIDEGNTTALYHNLPPPPPPPPPPTSTTVLLPSSLPLHSPQSPPPPPVPSSPTYNNSLSSSSLPILPSALPLQSDTTLPPPKDYTQPIPVATFHDHVHNMHTNGDRGFEGEYRQVRRCS